MTTKIPNQCEKRRASESARKILDEANANAVKAGNVLIDNCYDYAASLTPAGTEDDMEKFPPLPITPSKSPAPKKMMYTCENSE